MEFEDMVGLWSLSLVMCLVPMRPEVTITITKHLIGDMQSSNISTVQISSWEVVVNNVWEEKIQYQQEESNGFLQLAMEARGGWLWTGTVTVMVTSNIYAVVRKCFLYNPQPVQKQTHIYNLDLLQRMAVGEKEMQWNLIK